MKSNLTGEHEVVGGWIHKREQCLDFVSMLYCSSLGKQIKSKIIVLISFSTDIFVIFALVDFEISNTYGSVLVFLLLSLCVNFGIIFSVRSGG